jgi:hypothetical protein
MSLLLFVFRFEEFSRYIYSIGIILFVIVVKNRLFYSIACVSFGFITHMINPIDIIFS